MIINFSYVRIYGLVGWQKFGADETYFKGARELLDFFKAKAAKVATTLDESKTFSKQGLSCQNNTFIFSSCLYESSRVNV